MATRMELVSLARCTFPCRSLFRFVFLRLLSSLTIFLGAISPASAQTSAQQFLYTSGGSVLSGYSINNQTGGLTPVPGSPFNERLEGGLMAIDGQGKFLFVLNPTSDDVSMFQIDQTTGALTEVPGSPFAYPSFVSSGSTPPSEPLSISTEGSGQFVFVGYLLADGGNIAGPSAVASFAIDTSGSSPVLLPAASTLIQGSPIALLTDFKHSVLYVGMGMGNNGMQASGPDVYSFDGAGNLSLVGGASNPENNGSDFSIDPQGRFIFAVGGLETSHVISCVISPVDGTLGTCGGLLDLQTALPGMFVESSGHFLYLPDSNQSVVVYAVDQTTGDLTQLGSVTGISPAQGATVADPAGPYIYSAGLNAYLVDQQTGNLTLLAGSPFPDAGKTLVTNRSPVQAISGPAETIFPSTSAPFSATTGTVSSTQVFSLVNIGNQLLAISSISIVGSNASSFSQTNTCLATLAAGAHCSISINFNPAAPGTFVATLQIADNAPGSPQTLALNGTGATPAPAVSFSPLSMSFPAPPLASITEGTSSTPQVLTVFSTGNTTLNISSVTLGGPNASDFSFTNNCTAALAPSANCTISVVFSPIAPGQRTATLTFSDDAPNSPQTVSLSGTAVSAVSGGAAPNGSTSATVSAGQPAQYQLQLTPGSGFTGTIGLSCSGAPLAAVCQAPSSVAVTNGNPAPFNVTVTTSGPAQLLPSEPLRIPPILRVPLLVPLLLTLLFLLFAFLIRRAPFFSPAVLKSRLALCEVLSAAILCITFALTGCGGGSAAVTPPPPVITPSGTSTITISLSAASSTGQPLQLQPIQLTLTVK